MQTRAILPLIAGILKTGEPPLLDYGPQAARLAFRPGRYRERRPRRACAVGAARFESDDPSPRQHFKRGISTT